MTDPGRADDSPEPAGERGGPNTPLSLLQRVQAHQPDAWRRLVALYQPLVAHWCGKAGLRGADAEDVTQETFTALAAAIADFHRDHPGDTFRGWLWTVTRSQILLHFRRNRGRPRAEGGSDAWHQLQGLPDPMATPPDDDEAAEINQLYRRALDQVRADFEEKTWRAFWRTVIDARPPAILVDELGMSLAAIRQAKSRVLRRLRTEMGELLE
jgi:RNA polymerase sigma-70 factor (ECF subfamily)